MAGNIKRQVTFLFLAVVVTVIAITIGLSAAQYQDAVENAHRETLNIAVSLQEQALRTLNGTGERLSDVAVSFAGIPDLQKKDGPVQLLTVQGGSAPSFIQRIELLNTEGQLIGSSAPEKSILHDQSGKDYFKVHKEKQPVQLFVGAPGVAVSTAPLIPISRSLDAMSSSFEGVLVAWVAADLFHSLYSSFDIGAEGVIALLRQDGWLIARIPADPAMIGKNFGHSPVFEHLKTEQKGTFESLYVHDKSPRITGFVRMDALHLVLIVGRDKEELLRPWRTMMFYQLGYGLALSSVFAVFTFLVIRQVRSREKAESRARQVEEMAGQLSLEVAERKKAEQQIRSFNATLEKRVSDRTAQLEKALSDLEGFSYSVSHDLRAPMRAVHGFITILEEEYSSVFDDEGLRLLEVIRKNADKMGMLIDDILDFSKAGFMKIQYVSLDMNVLVQEVWEALAEQRKEVRYTFQMDELPAVEGDRHAIYQVWWNLLGNAIKFSHGREKPQIKVTAEETENEVRFCVTDNGVGFSQEYAGKLFVLFQRLHGMDEYEGTGLGLALSKRYIEKHGGAMTAEGEPDGGAVFCFTLPRNSKERKR